MRAAFASIAVPMLGFLVGLGACAHEPPQRVVHTTSVADAYRIVELNGAFEVELAVGPEASVELSGDQRALEQVKVVARGDALSVETRGPRPLAGKVKVRITTPEVESIEVNGAAGLELTGLHDGELLVELNGAGATHAKGALESLEVEINGAGSFEAADLVAQRVELEINGAGSATVHAKDSLHAALHGVGSVRYAGRPPVVEKELHGVGTVKPL